VRGGRSLNELNKLARIENSGSNAPAHFNNGTSSSNKRIVFIAVSVDPTPHAARAHGPTHWPHLRHHWIDATTIGELDIGFVPNRVVVDGRSKAEAAALVADNKSGSRKGMNQKHQQQQQQQQQQLPAKSAAPSFAQTPASQVTRSAPRVLRWWDGTAGNVLKGPHGASRGNGSHQLLDELRDLVSTPRTL
jgi:hypothetical protein